MSVLAHRGHEMGHPPKAGEHVAHIDPAHHGLLEPLGVRVLAVLQGIGAHVDQVLALFVDHPQVQKRPGSAVEQIEDAAQGPGLDQLFEAAGVGQHLQHGGALGQKELHRVDPVEGQVAQLLLEIVFLEMGEIPIPGRAHQIQRHQGGGQGDDDHAPDQTPVVGLHQRPPPRLAPIPGQEPPDPCGRRALILPIPLFACRASGCGWPGLAMAQGSWAGLFFK